MKTRRLTRLFALALLVLLSAPAGAKTLEESYEEVRPAQPTQSVGKIEVIEFFWYGCPHCYSFEPLLGKWMAARPADVEFVRVPGVLGANWLAHARAFYVAQKLGVFDKIHQPLFDAIHKDKQPIFSEEQLQAFFEAHGVAAEDFKKAFDSAETTTRIKQALLLAQNYKVDGVPTLIVNGKYRTSASMAGSYEALVKVIDALVARERGAAAQAAKTGAP